MIDPIRTRFEERGSGNFFFELEMPFPVRRKDIVNFEGLEWEVTKVTWMINSDEENNVKSINLLVEVK